MKLRHGLRWLALAVLCALLWVGLLMATIAAHYRIEQDLCPPAALVHGICNDRITGWGLWLLKHAAMVLSLMLVPGLAWVLAPSHRAAAAAGVLTLQVLVSLALSGSASSMYAAVAIGALLALLLIRRHGQRPDSVREGDSP